MIITRFTTGRTLIAVSVLAFATTLAAQGLQKIPDGVQLPKSADSPGQVLFNHTTHVDEAKPDCTVCHPKPWSILKGKKAAPVANIHERMDKGELCGSCHNGKKAFALDEDCTFCHEAEG